MSKGYADYVIDMMREIDREFQRESDGVEAPLFCDEFEEWLKTEVSESSQVNYMRWLRKADTHICDLDRDFWTLLKKAWDASDFEKAQTLCNEYEKQLLDEKALAEKIGEKEFGESGKEIGNWVSAFRKYQKFHEEQIKKAPADKKAFAAMIEASRQTANHLFLAFRFTLWGIANGMVESTMKSYVSYIKRINRELFCKTGYDLLYDYLPGYIKNKNIAKIDEMFGAMDDKLTERIENLDETEMPVSHLKNARTALSKYANFIRSVIDQAD